MLNMLQLLLVASLWLYFLVPPLLCGNLRCYYQPILKNGETAELILTQCPPNQLCHTADGHYGNLSALSARGCSAKRFCGRQRRYIFMGTAYTLSYACCDRSYCNSGVAAKPLYVIVTLMAVAAISGGS
ncbi:protein Bouncer [Mugil cephalus]|uniref:protein Bouncer n=1 Tax=Mugil cephalus TaxID=48193 RepID=UPI001FB77C9E|nr:protein Bouncer [Mugil cephalus]